MPLGLDVVRKVENKIRRTRQKITNRVKGARREFGPTPGGEPILSLDQGMLSDGAMPQERMKKLRQRMKAARGKYARGYTEREQVSFRRGV